EQATIFDHYSLANLYIKRGNFEKAVSEFLNVSNFIQSGDKSDIYQEEDMKVAINMAKKLLELRENIDDISAEDIDDIWTVESIGYLSFLSGDYEDSVNYFEKAKTIDQDLFEFYYENGYSYLNSIYPNKIFYGISNAKKAIKINPSSYSAHILLGRLYLLDNNPKDLVSGNDEAIKEFATAIELDNSKAEGYYYLGNALKNNGDYENALKVTKKALGIDPDYISAIEQEGDIYASTKLYNNALETYFDLYDMASEKNDSEKARIYEKIGTVYELKGEYESAVNEYNKAYRLVLKNSEKVKIHEKIGAVYELKGEYESAVNEYNKAFKLTRKDSEKARIYEKIGVVYELKGEYESAINEYNKAYELTNFNKFIEDIASAYRKEGYYEEAIDTMKRLIALDDRNPKYHFTLAYLYDEENRIEDAISEYNKVIRLNPQDTDALYNLGLAYINNKKKDMAIKQFGKYLEVTMNMPDKNEWRERAKGFIFNLEYPDMRMKFTDIGTITSLLSTELEYTRANHLFVAGALDTTPIHNSKNLTGYNVSPKIQEAKNIFRNVRESINDIVAISEETEEIKNLFLLAARDVERGVEEYLIGFQMKKTLLNGENEEGLTKIKEGNKYFLNGLNLLKEMMENHFDFFNEEYITHIDASIKYYFSKISD
ncbi:MAG: tetratricopeptide repeat protein, partial [Nitrospirota bacterium]